MLVELREGKAWWRINWGRPQRSYSIEVLGWASAEWDRDGWITPHNSYLHMVYRAGIIGLVIILVLFYLIGQLIIKFLSIRSIPGILLMSIFVYWMTIANFLVFLEFPYNAILFWGLLGMTIAFCEREEKRIKKTNL